jgi:hypothetical protein
LPVQPGGTPGLHDQHRRGIACLLGRNSFASRSTGVILNDFSREGILRAAPWLARTIRCSLSGLQCVKSRDRDFDTFPEGRFRCLIKQSQAS